MNTLEILGSDGDVTLTWDPADTEATDRARDEFERLRAAGYLLFTVRRSVESFPETVGELAVELVAAPAVTPAARPAVTGRGRRGLLRRAEGEEAAQAREFEPDAPRTIAVPPMRGGVGRQMVVHYRETVDYVVVLDVEEDETPEAVRRRVEYARDQGGLAGMSIAASVVAFEAWAPGSPCPRAASRRGWCDKHISSIPAGAEQCYLIREYERNAGVRT